MIYIHIPYCHQKCTYCAFFSSPTRRDRQPYVDALCSELDIRRHEQSHPITTIYFGGGTPSLLSIGQITQIIQSIRSYYDLSQVQEITLEANPEDLDEAFLSQLSSLRFFNRLSLGIQSFCDEDLRRLNRRHTAQQAIEAVQRAHHLGFQNISVDLIYSLPFQSAADWEANLQRLNAIEPLISHLSCYALTLEEGTILHRQILAGQLPPSNEELTLSHYHLLQRWISDHGWQQYEISSYCKTGFQSRHNSRYWDTTPYLGIGAGAHSFDGHQRRWNLPDIDTYISGVTSHQPYFESETLTPSDQLNEYLMTSLRTTSGISLRHIQDHFPWALQELLQRAERYFATFLTQEHHRLVPTPEGLLHADGIASDLFFLK